MTAGVTWPWFAFAALGIFHGLNPAMGWLFAVALGLYRNSRQIVVVALLPMAIGHALSVWLIASLMIAMNWVVNAGTVRLAAGMTLLLWAGYHWIYGHRHRVRVGMTASLTGLAVWSFVMASAHGAGLMLVPALLPLCSAMPNVGNETQQLVAAAVAVHTAATLATTGIIALIVYNWLGLAGLRRGWINFDLLWTCALILTGLMLIATI
jgi:hypothetical protein